jgi:hypothetical protein
MGIDVWRCFATRDMMAVDEGNEIELVVRFYVDWRPRLGKPTKTGSLMSGVLGPLQEAYKKEV